MIEMKINYDKCIECKKCVDICPANLFQLKDERIVIESNRGCIECFHCAATCPNEAVEFNCLENTDKMLFRCEAFKVKNTKLKSIEEHIIRRRSYRNFNCTPVSKEKIMYALELSKWAPSAKNEHPSKYTVLSDRRKLDELMNLVIKYVKENDEFPEIIKLYEQGKNIVLGKASTIIVAYADPNMTNPQVDTALALYSIELILQSQGIGTCWSGYFASICNKADDMRRLLKIPDGYNVYGVLLVGYVENKVFLGVPNRLKQIDVNWI